MNITTFAAIYIGSYEISMKIFELSAKRKIREVDYIRKRVELGKDAYAKGYIGYELAEELCSVLSEYTRIMAGYKVDAYKVCASAAIRDAKNELFILDQIKLRTKLDVEVLSNSEHRFISYKSVAARPEFNKMIEKGAAVVDVGGGSLQITLFQKGKAITTQHLLLGTMRIYEKLSEIGNAVIYYDDLIKELVDKELERFKDIYLKDNRLQYLIMMGDYSTEIVRKLEKNLDRTTVDAGKFVKYLNKMNRNSLGKIAEELSLSNATDPLLLPSIVLYKRIAEELDADSIWVPGSDINDGIACDYALEHNMIRVEHDFDEDVISASKYMAQRYHGYTPHIDALTEMATLVFDSMKRVHGMGKRERLLLQVAAILHDCGKYVSLVNGPECAYSIIMASEIIGLSHLEREIVACTVKYNTYPLDDYEVLADKLDQESYMVVAKLAAILKVSNAMDRSHKQKFKNVKASLRGKQLVITIESMDDIVLEKGLFAAKSGDFERIFSVKPVIKEKHT